MEATSDLRLCMVEPVADKEKGDRVLGVAGPERMSMNAVGKMEGTVRTVPESKVVEGVTQMLVAGTDVSRVTTGAERR